jgi:DMSO/TMAO reductase YedYZ molybdopterin-dependent catalytic subunit
MNKKIFKASLLTLTLGLILSNASTFSFGYQEWTMQIDGEVSKPLSFALEDLASMPQTTVNADLYCYGNLVTSGNWIGVKVSYLLEMAEFNEHAISVKFYAEDGYAINIPIQEALRDDVIIAYKKDNQLLPETLRLVIPDTNGNLWISMIKQVTLSAEAPSPPQSGLNTLKSIQPSAKPQQSPTPPSTPTPSPESTPSPYPSPSYSPAPIGAKTPPVTWITITVAGVTGALVIAIFLAYIKKRKR